MKNDMANVNVKNTVLTFLEKNKGNFISGSDIARSISVSRNAVWKAVMQLKEEGHCISSSKALGYRLEEGSKILSNQSIQKYLKTSGLVIEVQKSVTSTNTVLKARAEAGGDDGTVLIAENQTDGRGRMGRNFFSPSGTGIYMSLLLRPKMPASECVMITTCAAVAVSKAIEKICGIEAHIKWVNDIFCGGKKVCGILTEAALSAESGYLSYAVLGIGINVFSPICGFPDGISNIAAPIISESKCDDDIRSRLIAEVLDNFYSYYDSMSERVHFDEYKRRLFVLGKPVEVVCGNNTYDAVVRDIDREFRLKVELSSGEMKYLDSGEVSVRPQ